MTCEEVREKLAKLGTVSGMLQCNLNLIKLEAVYTPKADITDSYAAPQKTLWQHSVRLFGRVLFWGVKTPPPHTSLGEER